MGLRRVVCCLLYATQLCKKMMTAVGVPGQINYGITAGGMLPNYASAFTGGSTGSSNSTGTTPSSLCSTPVTLFGSNPALNPNFSLLQPGLASSLYSPPVYGAPQLTSTLGSSANIFEGVPIFLVPQSGASAGTVPLSAFQRAAEFKAMSAQQPKMDTSKHFHVFVGDLSQEVDNNVLKQAFDRFGEISEVKVIRDSQSLKSRGYGFVTFPRKEDADRAIQEMNGQIIGKRAIRTNWAVRRPNDEEKKAHTYEQIYNAATSDNTTVYLGNIVPSITEESIREAFEKHGKIKEIRLFGSQSYAFVIYETKEEAAKAILEMNGAELEGQTLKCSWGRTNDNALQPATNALLAQLAGLTSLPTTIPGLQAGLSALSNGLVATPQLPFTGAFNPLYPSLINPGLLPTWHT
uniref:RRM domain-containing protein n=1 Tax=Acrobeloides nanus TaxID=290746 RepID=A0A914DQA8_9BILA